MSEIPVDALRRVVEDLHGCRAWFVRTVHVRETIDGMPPWDGQVSVFDLTDHPTAARAYAWSYETGGGAARCFVARLHGGTVCSPQTALRASAAPRQDERTADSTPAR